jgi:hypothetical protein
MQNRYVADIGDYLKLAILRALSSGCRLGVAWWLYPDETHNTDGRHIGYLNHAAKWRHYDAHLFDALGQIVSSGRRHVRALEAANVLPGAVFHCEPIPSHGAVIQRRQARHEWFQTVLAVFLEADLVFVDPDNGLEPAGFSHGSAKAGKSVTLHELRKLRRPGRCLIVYHHHTRRAGGHYAELDYGAARLRVAGFDRVDALRAKPYSPRVFFLLDAPGGVRQRAAEVERRWCGLITWHPDLGRHDATLSRTSDRATMTKAGDRPQERSLQPAILSFPASERHQSKARADVRIGCIEGSQQEAVPRAMRKIR